VKVGVDNDWRRLRVSVCSRVAPACLIESAASALIDYLATETAWRAGGGGGELAGRPHGETGGVEIVPPQSSPVLD